MVLSSRVFTSIDPTLKKDGSFRALAFHDRALELKPVPLGSDDPFCYSKVFQDTMTVSAALSLNLGTIFGNESSVNSVALITA